MQANPPISFAEQIARLSPDQKALLKSKLKNNNAIEPISPQPRNGTIPLSFAQQGFWLFEQLEPNQAVNNEWTACRIDGLLDIEALKQSIQAIINRHEILRTYFTVQDEQPIQLIKNNLNVSVNVESLQHLPEEKRWAEMKRLSILETQRPFYLNNAPLLRISLFKFDEQTHVLLLVFHHIITDAWTATIFYKELGVLYTDFSHQRSSSLGDLHIQYADFSIFEQTQSHSQIFKTQLTYWQKQLTDLSPLELPTDYPRPSKQCFQGAQQSLILSKELFLSLKRLSQQEGCSMFMTLLATFQTLLHRYSGQNDIAVGSPVANRKQPETKELMGCFINTLVFRSDFSQNISFRTLLQQVRNMVLDTLSNQDVPFDKLVKELHPKRDLSRNPLFQVMFVYNNTALSVDHFGILKTSLVDIESTVSPFDLSLHITEFGNELKAYFKYNTDLFDVATIQRMAEYFTLLLTSITKTPDQTIGLLPLLSQAEIQQLKDWNNTTTNYPKDKTIIDLFELQVEKTPDDIALVFSEDSLTYRQLNQQANQLAHYLLSLKTEDGNYLLTSVSNPMIAIAVEPSLEMVIGLLAILKAGGAYIPLDPDYPVERLAFMLDNSNTLLLLTQSKFDSITDELIINHKAIQRVYVDSQESINFPQYLETNINSEMLAYVIYTSGSTGKPKGVQISHRSVVNFLISMYELTEVSPQDSLLSITSSSFDIVGLEIYLPLICGAKIVLADKKIIANGFDLAKKLSQTNSITMIQGTPATWRLLQLANWSGNQNITVLSGGESLPIDLASYLESKSKKVWNLYGPTETTIWSTAYPLNKASNTSSIPIGRPIANTKIHILDKYMQLVPVGVHGELHISGDGLAKGYLNHPELTAEKFRMHSFNNEAPIRIYKTGDLARYLSNGTVEILGRIDQQVKLRGFRIELGEIEAILLQYSEIQEVVATIIDFHNTDKEIVAYIVPKNKGKIPLISELRQFLKKKLPDYMLPFAFVAIQALPLTPNNKVDLSALPNPDGIEQLSPKLFSGPQGELECALSNLWKKTLNISSIDREDNFFDLGGYSLLFFQLSKLIEKNLGIFFPENTLLQGYSIKDQAIYIHSLSNSPLGEQKAKQLNLSDSDYNRLFTFANGKNQDQHPNYPLIFPYNEELPGVPLYFVTGSKYLASNIKNRPYYDLLSGFNIINLNKSNFSALADYYTSAIIDLNPSGPYILGGYCSGGLLAFEIAKRLLTRNKIVPLLIMVDQSLPHPYSEKISFLPFNDNALIEELSRLDETELLIKFYPKGWTVDIIHSEHLGDLDYISSILIAERIEARIKQTLECKNIPAIPESAKQYEIKVTLDNCDFNELSFNVLITNNSQIKWPKNQIYITDFWLSPYGRVIEFKKNKYIIDHDCLPGEEYSFSYSTNNIMESGEFTLYIFLSDMFGTDFKTHNYQTINLQVDNYNSLPMTLCDINKIFDMGDLNMVIQQYRRNLYTYGEDRPEVLMKLSDTLSLTREIQYSIDVHKKSLQYLSNKDDKLIVFQSLSDKYFSLKNYEKSNFYTKKALHINNEDLKSILYLGLNYSKNKKYSEASRLFKNQIVKYNDHYPNELSSALVSFFKIIVNDKADYKYIRNILKKIPTANSNDVQLLLVFIYIKINENKFEDAELELVRFIENHPYMPVGYELLCSVYMDNNKIDKAISIKYKLCELKPFSIECHEQLIDLLENEKDILKIKKHINRIAHKKF